MDKIFVPEGIKEYERRGKRIDLNLMPGWPSGPRPIIRWDARALRARGSCDPRGFKSHSRRYDYIFL